MKKKKGEKKNRKWTADVDKSLRNNKYVVHIKRERRTAWKSLQTGSLLVPPSHFNVPTNFRSPGRIQCFIYLFSQHPTYIYIHCVYISPFQPSWNTHSFFSSSFFVSMFPLQLRPNDRSWCIFFLFGTGIPQQETPTIALYYIPDVMNFVSV